MVQNNLTRICEAIKMISDVEKRNKIKHYHDNRSEVELMNEVLTPLFDNMGYHRVRFNHGPRELGKDYILVTKDELEEISYTVVVVKNENIRNTSKSEQVTLFEVMRQAEQSESIIIDCFPDLPKKLPSKVIILTSGLISDTAEKEIATNLKYLQKSNISFINQDKLISLISLKNPSFFKNHDPFLSTYIENLKDSIVSETSQDIFSSGILGKFEVKCRMVDSDDSPKLKTDSPKSFQYEKALEIISKKNNFWIQGGFGSGKSYTLVQYINEIEKKLKVTGNDSANLIYIKAHPKEKYDIETIIKESIMKHIPSLTNEGFERILYDYELLIIVDEFEKIIYKNSNDFISELIKYLDSLKLKKAYRIGLMSREFTAYNQRFTVSFDIWSIVDTNFNELVEKFKKDFVVQNAERFRKYKDMTKDGMLKRIPKTPLALNILYHVFSVDFDKTPQNLFEFFDLYFELVLGRWNKNARNASSVTDYSQVRPLLEELSFTMCSQDTDILDIDYVVSRIDKYLRDVGDISVNRKDYLKILTTNSEIVSITGGTFHFKERVFQEFLAGCHIAKHSWSKDFLLENILNPTWQEPIIFAAGSKNRDNNFLNVLNEIKTTSIDDKFSKLRVISLITQALYHSDENEKCNSIKASLDLIMDIRNDKELKSYIKLKSKLSEDFYYTLLTLSTYNYIYSRNTLLLPFTTLLPNVDNRQKAYIISALSTIEIPEQLMETVNEGLRLIKSDTTVPESAVLGIIFKSNQKLGSLPHAFAGKTLTSFYKKSMKSAAPVSFLKKKLAKLKKK